MTRDRKYKINGARVYGNGKSFNCTNKVTAIELQTILNNYEITIENHNKTNDKIQQCNKQLKQVLMDLSILKSDIEELKEVLNK